MGTARLVVDLDGNERTFDVGPVIIGGRPGCDIVVRDPMIADRHCAFVHEDGFRVRDLGSASGTWVDGKPALPSAPVADGAVIVIGTTRIEATVEKDETGASTLRLSVSPQSFHWKRPGKNVFDNDPDAMVRREVAFGAFPSLRVGNRLAAVAGAVLLLAGIFVTSAVETLADPGPLLPTHAFVAATARGAAGDAAAVPAHAAFARCVELASQQGCDVCHTTGQGTPEQKCLQCHGDLAAEGSWRHPYHNDGKLGPVPGIDAGANFCVECHRDHQGDDWLKPRSAKLVGDCAACHHDGNGAFDRDALLARAPVVVAAEQQRPYSTYRFPHDAHVQKEIDCRICHRVDQEVESARRRGAPDDQGRADFAAVPYEVCASCHLPGAAAVQMTADEQTRFSAKDHQWTVRWHGTDEGGKHCRACHQQGERDGAVVFGPELRTTERFAFTPDQHRAERARYDSGARRHEEQFAAHAGDRACSSCHLDGKVKDDGVRPARPFWHALHVAEGALTPAAGKAGAVSIDAAAGCVSCHRDLAGNQALQPASAGPYHWPETAEARAACSECHREQKGQPLALRAVTGKVADDRRRTVADFPHDVHVGSAAFGTSGVLADGCFACHDFAGGGDALALVPTTKPGAADCTSCHRGHDHIGGGDCQQCHPNEVGRSNSFLVAAKAPVGSTSFGRAVPAPPTRAWPGRNGFSHLSRGHVGPDLTCATCHGDSGLDRAKTLADVRVPDERASVCRDCHLQQQFHWR